MFNPNHILDHSTTLSQPDIAGFYFTITGSDSSSAPVVINLTSDITLISAANLFSSASGYWVFNGNGHTITIGDSLHAVSGFSGLFTTINSGGIVENLSIAAANGSTLATASGPVARTNLGLIDHASSNFEISNNSGGIVGTMLAGGVVANSYSTGAISGSWGGGIVGRDNAGTVHDSYSTGAISGDYSGGIASLYNTGPIFNVYTRGDLSGYFAGGIVGNNSTGSITNVYTTGSMGSAANEGGIAYYDGDEYRGGFDLSHAYTTGSLGGGLQHYELTFLDQRTPLNGHVGSVSNSFGSNGSPWLDSVAGNYLIGVGPIWTDPAGTSTPYTLASHPGAYTVTGTVSNNAWAGNTLQIRITDPTLNNGNSFYADQAALHGFSSDFFVGAPAHSLFNATYQWYADGVAINGATSATFTLPGAYLGKTITAQVNYMNGLGVAGTGYVQTTSSATVNGITDLAANVSTYLDSIEANHAAISNALTSTGQFSIYDGSNTAVHATIAQLTSDSHAISLIKDHSYLVGVSDNAANIASGIDALLSNGLVGRVDYLTISDLGLVHLSSAQESVLASIVGSNGINLSNHTFDSTVLVNQAADGTLYVKADGNLLTCSNYQLALFNGVFSTGDGIYAHASSIVPLFASSGGVNGLTLPDLFTGPSSLGLTYQLIDSTQNAVVTGASSNDFIKVSDGNSIGKAVNGGGGSDVIDGGVGSTFVTGGENHSDTFFLDGRAPGVSWSTITDFKAGTDKATIWGFVKGVSSIDTSFTNYDHEGAAGYQGLTLHFKNLLPDGQTAGSNPNLNSITFSGHTLAELGASSLADLNSQINAGTNVHILVGSTQDSLGTHSYLYFH